MPKKIKTNVKNQSNLSRTDEEALQPTFEGAMSELDGIVDRLEQDDLTLDDALACFERGISLLRTCDTHLNQVRGKIAEILKGENGVFTEKILGTSLESFLSKENDHE